MKRNPDQTRQSLLEAAFGEIHRHGFQAASIGQILSDTGLTKGALYHHFPDKKALGLAVIDDVIRPRFTAWHLDPIRTSPFPLAALRAVIVSRRDEVDAAYIALGCPINNLMQEMSPLDEGFRAALTALVNEWQETLVAGLRYAQTTGELRDGVDPAQAALFIVSSIWGCIGVAKSLQSLETYRACLTQLVNYLDTLKGGTSCP
ncbi:MAG: TetR/AcrR family transcriptional regulator [Magnetospirillum sp.]|nr:TetR/AcrR family transcriptional regulator [Magnetospirillum sp.]